MTKTLTLEGDLGTVDARTAITTQGSVVAPSLVTPAAAKKIDRIVCACAPDGLAVGSGVFFLRLGGSAVQRGEQTIMVSSAGVIAVQAGSDAAPNVNFPIIIENADIDVSGGDTIAVSAEMAGSDLGTGHIVVTLIFA